MTDLINIRCHFQVGASLDACYDHPFDSSLPLREVLVERVQLQRRDVPDRHAEAQQRPQLRPEPAHHQEVQQEQTSQGHQRQG